MVFTASPSMVVVAAPVDVLSARKAIRTPLAWAASPCWVAIVYSFVEPVDNMPPLMSYSSLASAAIIERAELLRVDGAWFSAQLMAPSASSFDAAVLLHSQTLSVIVLSRDD